MDCKKTDSDLKPETAEKLMMALYDDLQSRCEMAGAFKIAITMLLDVTPTPEIPIILETFSDKLEEMLEMERPEEMELFKSLVN